MLGLIGGPLIIASGTAVLLGVIEPESSAQVIATVPGSFWEAPARHLPHREGVPVLPVATGAGAPVAPVVVSELVWTVEPEVSRAGRTTAPPSRCYAWRCGGDEFEGARLDGVIAKPLDGTYQPDKRVMFKLKHLRTPVTYDLAET